MKKGFSPEKRLTGKLPGKWFVVFWLPEKMNGGCWRRWLEFAGEDGRSLSEKTIGATEGGSGAAAGGGGRWWCDLGNKFVTFDRSQGPNP